jgi:hypothetical protein
MKKYIIWFLIIVAVIIFAVWHFNSKKENPSNITSSYKDITFRISGEPITFVNGYSETAAAPGSASKVVTKYFGNQITKDLDGDGALDVAYLITQNSGGSGTFFYLVGALKRGSGYVGTSAVYIGDRIAPQTTESGPNRQILVNYADRKPGEAMTTQPSVGKSLYLLLDVKTLQFGEVVQNFEGESK